MRFELGSLALHSWSPCRLPAWVCSGCMDTLVAQLVTAIPDQHREGKTAQTADPTSLDWILNYFLKGQKWNVLINPNERYSTLCPFSRNMYWWFCSLLPTGITCAFPLPSCCCHSLKSICCFTRWSVILLKCRGVMIACTPIVWFWSRLRQHGGIFWRICLACVLWQFVFFIASGFSWQQTFFTLKCLLSWMIICISGESNPCPWRKRCKA